MMNYALAFISFSPASDNKLSRRRPREILASGTLNFNHRRTQPITTFIWLHQTCLLLEFLSVLFPKYLFYMIANLLLRFRHFKLCQQSTLNEITKQDLLESEYSISQILDYVSLWRKIEKIGRFCIENYLLWIVIWL